MSAAEGTARSLVDAIARGSLRAGEPLPAIKQAALRFGTSDRTIASAYRALCQQGLAYRLGRRFIVGSAEHALRASERRDVLIFLDNVRAMTDMPGTLAFAFAKLERELYRFGSRVAFHDSAALPVHLEAWSRSGLLPFACVIAGNTLPPPLARWLEHLRLETKRAPRILLVGNVRESPRGLEHLHVGNALVTQVSHALAAFVQQSDYSRVFLFLDRTAQGQGERFGGLLKIRTEMVHVRPALAVEIVVKTEAPGSERGREIPDLFGNIPRDAPVQVASKYRRTTRADVEGHVKMVSSFAQVIRKAGPGDLLVFNDEGNAVLALEQLRHRGVAVPGEVSLISREARAQNLSQGISCCLNDWETTGYIMAHALLRDVPVARTSQGYLRTSALLLHRGTTPG